MWQTVWRSFFACPRFALCLRRSVLRKKDVTIKTVKGWWGMFSNNFRHHIFLISGAVMYLFKYKSSQWGDIFEHLSFSDCFWCTNFSVFVSKWLRSFKVRFCKFIILSKQTNETTTWNRMNAGGEGAESRAHAEQRGSPQRSFWGMQPFCTVLTIALSITPIPPSSQDWCWEWFNHSTNFACKNEF